MTKSQRQQLQQQQDEKYRIKRDKAKTLSNRLDKAREALSIYKKKEKLYVKHLQAIIIYVLPIVEAEDAPSHYKTKAQMNERLE